MALCTSSCHLYIGVHDIHSIFDVNGHVYFVCQGWINVTKRLRGDDNVDGTCIPQVQLLYILFINFASKASLFL